MDGTSDLTWRATPIGRSERHEAWRSTLSEVYGSWTVDGPVPDDFDAQLTRHTVGSLQIVDCACDPCSAVRTRANINQDGLEAVTIQLILSGVGHFAVDDERMVLEAGDVLIWNTLRPMSFEVGERFRKISVTFPLSRLKSWLPDSWHSIESRLPRTSPGARLMSSFIKSVSSEFLAGHLRNSQALTESVIGLLVNVVGADQSAKPVTLRGAQLASVKSYIDTNLDDPELSPLNIAHGKRISVRYLHALFEAEGLTVQQHIIQQRLLRCRRELENPMMAGRTITDIAFSWGFQNSTHFSRRFRAAFDVSPQEFRASAAAEEPGRPARGYHG